jgi:hypothetical protein
MKRLNSSSYRILEISHAVPTILEMIAMSYLVGPVEDGGLPTCMDLVPNAIVPPKTEMTFMAEGDASPNRTPRILPRGLDN